MGITKKIRKLQKQEKELTTSKLSFSKKEQQNLCHCQDLLLPCSLDFKCGVMVPEQNGRRLDSSSFRKKNPFPLALGRRLPFLPNGGWRRLGRFGGNNRESNQSVNFGGGDLEARFSPNETCYVRSSKTWKSWTPGLCC